VAKAPVLCARTFVAADEVRFVMRDDFAAWAAADPWDWSKGPPGPTWTLCKAPGDLACEVLGIAGLNRYGPSRMHLWARLGLLGPRQWVQALGLTAHILEQFVRFNPGLVVTAQAASAAGERCLRRLGFDDQGPLQLVKESG
jgi:hypothetical protein